MRYCLLLFIFFYCTRSIGQHLSSGGVLKPEQAIMDIRHYTIALDVDIARQRISGYTTIDLTMLQPTKTLLFDLLDSFTIHGILVNGKHEVYDYKNNMIDIHLSRLLQTGNATVTIYYEGQPHTAIRPPWDDGFTWTKDSTGNPWVAVTSEGTGGKIFFPCKDNPSDEPDDGGEMLITVPKGLVVAGPGILKKVTVKNNKVTYDWKTQYTINNYSLVFNIGKYKMVGREYTTVNGNKVPIQFYVLEEHADKAPHHLDIFEQTIRVQEKYFGEYPWVKEKIGISETPHLGMEHQTMNAYGNQFRYTKVGGKDFDWLLHHEFGHEWWGNKVTVKDWADYWIHEGICNFGDVLYVREMEGEAAYLLRFQQMALRFQNQKPVVQGKDIDEETAYQDDIYGKGAFFMHTLRYVMGDSIFFPTLKEFVTDKKYTYHNLVTTDDVEKLFSKNSGKDLGPLFNLYLKTTNKLEVNMKRVQKNEYHVSLGNIEMALPMFVATSEGPQNVMIDKKGTNVKSSTLPIIDPDMLYLKKITIE
ncbi:MAG: M1 family metallopeptidase [Ginsengibacter sp.]